MAIWLIFFLLFSISNSLSALFRKHLLNRQVDSIRTIKTVLLYQTHTGNVWGVENVYENELVLRGDAELIKSIL